MYEITIAILSVFAVWGMMDIVGKVCDRLLGRKPSGKITIYLDCAANAIECMARSLLRKNPTAEIIIVSDDKESQAIAERLSRVDGRVKIY